MNEEPLKMPVSEVTVAAYYSVFGRLGLFLELAWLPLLILLGISILPAMLPANFIGGGDRLKALLGLLELLAGGLCLNAFAVRWHQVTLYGGKASLAGKAWLGPWGRFVGYTVAIYCAIGLDALLLLMIAGATGQDNATAQIVMPAAALLLTLPVWLATTRFSLVFPAAAAERPLAFSAAWRAMRGNTWRLILCFFLVCAPLVLAVLLAMATVFALLGYAADGALESPPMGLYILRGLIDTVANFLIVALGAVVLVEFYKRLVLAPSAR
jgi:hypothetical protein